MINWKLKVIIIILAIGTSSMLVTILLGEKKKENPLVKLNAEVFFDGSRITVKNNDTLDYLNAELTLNGYYKISNMNLRGGETYTFWPVEFAHINGQRLPARQKPQQFAIWCNLQQGGNGFISVKFLSGK